MARLDPHSYADDTQAETASLSLTASVDFETRTLRAAVTLTLTQPSDGAFDLDTRDLTIVPRVEEVLAAVGRLKFLRSLYTALAKDPATRPVAERAFAKNRAGYHPISRQLVESVLREPR